MKGPWSSSPAQPRSIDKGEELEQLLSRLGFPDLTGLNVESLLGAAEGNLDRLLSRFRILFKEERIVHPLSGSSVLPFDKCIGFASRRTAHL